jgi:putative transposase
MASQARRKSIRHFDTPSGVHMLTFSTLRRQPLMLLPGVNEFVAASIDRACERHQYRLLAFVFMPEHIHLVVHAEPEASRVSALLYAMKHPASHRVNRPLEGRSDPACRRIEARRSGRIVRRLWQAGPGFDRNLSKRETVRKAIEYVHANPLRRELVAHPSEWRWSSWRVYADHALEGRTTPRVSIFRG